MKRSVYRSVVAVVVGMSLWASPYAVADSGDDTSVPSVVADTPSAEPSSPAPSVSPSVSAEPSPQTPTPSDLPQTPSPTDSPRPTDSPTQLPQQSSGDVTPTEEPSSTPTPVESVNIFRAFNPATGEHLYSRSAEEIYALVRLGWWDEGVAWKAPKESDYPVYRLYSAAAQGHFLQVT